MVRTGLVFSDPDPLSLLGTDVRSRTLFRAGLLLAAVLLGAFAGFVHQRRSTPRCFLLVFLIGLGGQVVAAIVPLSGRGASPAVHTTGGLVLGISLPVLMGCFAAGQPAGSWRRLSWALFWLEAGALGRRPGDVDSGVVSLGFRGAGNTGGVRNAGGDPRSRQSSRASAVPSRSVRAGRLNLVSSSLRIDVWSWTTWDT